MFGKRAGLVMGVAAAVAVLPMSAQAARPERPKPDLVIKGKSTVKPKWFLWGFGDTAHFTARTKNSDKAKAKAGASETSLVFRERNSRHKNRTAVISNDVPALNPGKSQSGGASGDVPGRLPPGSYEALICADYRDKVKESNERNNCSETGIVFVIPGSWKATLSGSAGIDIGVTETWRSDGATFEGGEYLGDGQFRYRFRGSLHYAASGTDVEGCVYAGEGSATVTSDDQLGGSGNFGLTFDYRKGQYWGSEQLAGAEFPYNVSCQGEPDSITGPVDFAAGFIVVAPIDAKPLEFGTVLISGSATEPSFAEDLPPSNWSWELAAVE
jgi:hypothetical protein